MSYFYYYPENAPSTSNNKSDANDDAIPNRISEFMWENGIKKRRWCGGQENGKIEWERLHIRIFFIQTVFRYYKSNEKGAKMCEIIRRFMILAHVCVCVCVRASASTSLTPSNKNVSHDGMAAMFVVVDVSTIWWLWDAGYVHWLRALLLYIMDIHIHKNACVGTETHQESKNLILNQVYRLNTMHTHSSNKCIPSKKRYVSYAYTHLTKSDGRIDSQREWENWNV